MDEFLLLEADERASYEEWLDMVDEANEVYGWIAPEAFDVETVEVPW